MKREKGMDIGRDKLLPAQQCEYGHPQKSNVRHIESLIGGVEKNYLPHQHLLTDTLCNDDFGHSFGNKNASLDELRDLSMHATGRDTMNENFSIVDYAELRLEKTALEQNYKFNTTDIVDCRHPAQIDFRTTQGINSLKQDIIAAGQQSTSSGPTEYAEIMNMNYTRHQNTPPGPIYVVTSSDTTTTPSDHTITSSHFDKRNSTSDYILMSSPSPLAIPLTSFSFDVLPVTASRNNNANSNSSSFVSKSYSGSSVSNSHTTLEPSPSIGGFSVAGRNVSTPEIERRRLSAIRISSISF